MINQNAIVVKYDLKSIVPSSMAGVEARDENVERLDSRFGRSHANIALASIAFLANGLGIVLNAAHCSRSSKPTGVPPIIAAAATLGSLAFGGVFSANVLTDSCGSYYTGTADNPCYFSPDDVRQKVEAQRDVNYWVSTWATLSTLLLVSAGTHAGFGIAQLIAN
jgi:hypothetical protein